jgi:hypothetical protein
MRRIVLGLTAAITLETLLANASALAQPSQGDDSVGFGDSALPSSETSQDALGFGEEAPPGAQNTQAAEPSALSIGGRYRLRSALWLERLRTLPLAQVRNLVGLWASYSLDFELFDMPVAVRLKAAARAEYDAAYLVDRSRYDRPTLDTYEWQLVPEETFASLSIGPFELSAGLLKIALGQAEILGSIALNPRDLRDPGMTDVEDLVLPVLTSHAVFSQGPHRLDAYVVHEAYFGLRAPPLGLLSPLRKLLAGDAFAGPQLAQYEFRYRDEPRRFDPRATQVLGRYRLSTDGLDLELYAGSILDQLGIIELASPVELQSRRAALDSYHPRYTKLAHAGAWNVESLLVRWELVLDLGHPLGIRHVDSAYLWIDMARRSQLTGLLGITYFGTSHLNVGLELQQTYVFDNPERHTGSQRTLLLPVESTQVGLRLSYNFFHDKMQLSALTILFGIYKPNAALVYTDLRYALAGGLWLALGGIVYIPSAHFGPLYGFNDNDRLFAELRWDFTLL